MSPETIFIKDRVAYFLNQTILSPVNAQKLAPAPEIAQTPVTKQQKEKEVTKAIQQIKDLNFTPTETNSLLKNILNGFAREPRGWNQYAIRASLEILPFIGLNKLYPTQITATYADAIVLTLPSHYEVTADGGFEALIEAGMILFPHMSAVSRKKTDTQVVSVLRQELAKRYPYINKGVYENLVGKIDNLDYALKTGLVKSIDIKPIDTTAIANKFKEFSNNLWYKQLSPEQFARLDSLVKEAIKEFGMSAIQIIEMSNMSRDRIDESIGRLKASGSIPDRNVYENSLGLKVQELLGKGPLTQSQIAHALGPGITKDTVGRAKRRFIERGQHEKNSNNQPQEKNPLEQDIINLRKQDFSHFQIANRLDIPRHRVKKLIDKLIREEKIERQIRSLRLNHPIIERGIKIDAHVDKMKSNNPGVTSKEVAERLKLPILTVKNSFGRLEVYRQIEQLIQEKKTAAQIADKRGISIRRAEFLIARTKKLHEVQLNPQPKTPFPSTG